MMDPKQRSQYLQALGLTEWHPRSDGPLAARRPPSSMEAVLQAATPASASDLPPAADEMVAEFEDCASVTAGSAPSVVEPGVPTGSSTEPVRSDRAACAGMNWSELEAYLGGCDHRGAQQPVFGIGARDADVLIVGEAPGAQEDASGIPFVGRAGKLLDRMLFAIGCSRETNVYITNICKFRPPNNRDPRPEEIAADWPILERQIELMQPKLVVAVGRVAAQVLLDTSESLGRLRGRQHRYPQRDLDVLVTYHPAYLLRSPQQKAKAWDDLRMIAAYIATTSPAR